METMTAAAKDRLVAALRQRFSLHSPRLSADGVLAVTAGTLARSWVELRLALRELRRTVCSVGSA